MKPIEIKTLGVSFSLTTEAFCPPFDRKEFDKWLRNNTSKLIKSIDNYSCLVNGESWYFKLKPIRLGHNQWIIASLKMKERPSISRTFMHVDKANLNEEIIKTIKKMFDPDSEYDQKNYPVNISL
jgi:hypothetical protein